MHLHPRPSDGSLFGSGDCSEGEDDTQAIRQQEVQHYLARLRALQARSGGVGHEQERPALLLGDFNEPEESRAVTYLKSRGFTDALEQYVRTNHTSPLLAFACGLLRARPRC
jgi:endonuclease/exonuclease/phosphatase (EEP) superfamily protein YafD